MKTILSLALLLAAMPLFSQSGIISGTVTDDKDQTLVGVTILIKNTTKGAISDLDGNFVLTNVPQGQQTLEFSFVGFEKIEKTVQVSGEEVDLGKIVLIPSTVGLEEVQVFASMVEDRNTPIAVSNIKANEIDERFADIAIPDIISSTPGIFATQGAGGFGDNEIYIRGFDQTNVAFMVNGIPINDMENGRMFWSNFAGLSEVTRNMQVQRGLGASKLAINSIGGTVNMITKPADKNQGGRIEYGVGTGTYNQRIRFTYNTGESSRGWAFSFQGVRTTTGNGLSGLGYGESALNSIIPGAFVDGWSYYVAASKKINKSHSLQFWGFGAPLNRGSAFIAGEDIREELNIDSRTTNIALGYRNGELFNARQNRINKPLTALTHYWNIDRNTSLTTSLYYSYADVYSTQPRSNVSGIFLDPESDPNFGDFAGYDENGLIRWDAIEAHNQMQGAADYYMEARFNNHNWVGVISNLRKDINNLSLLTGIDLRAYRGKHFVEVYDLLGADYVINQNRFGDPFNKLNLNDTLQVGDQINYDYDGKVMWAAAFAQGEYKVNNDITIFATGTLSNINYQRIGNFWFGGDFGGFQRNSLGPSRTFNFLTYTTKAGASYRITGRHKVYLNGGYFTRPPFLVNSFVDTRYSNKFVDGLEPEKVTAFEAGYNYRSGNLQVNANIYNTIWRDRTTSSALTQSDLGDDPNSQVVLDLLPGRAITGLAATHRGVEVDFVWNILPSLELNGFVSLGDWYWTDSAATNIDLNEYDLNQQFVSVVDIDGLPASNSAQTTAGLGFHYSGIRSTYVGMRWNYADRLFPSWSPEDLINGFITEEQILRELDPYVIGYFYAGHYFDISDDLTGRLSVSVQNVTDATYVRWSSYFNGNYNDGFGFPRTFNITLSVQF